VQRVVFALLTYAFLYILAWLGRGVIDFLKSLFGEVDLFRAFEGAFAPPNLEPVEQLGDAPFTPEQLAMTKAFGVIAVVLIVLLMVGLSVRKLRVRARRRDEDHESVWEEVNLRHSLRDLLNDGRRRLGEIADSLSRSRLGQIFAALTIRRIYAHLGALAAEMGHPRALHETPYEYRSTLEQIFPDNHADVDQITKAYVDVHYGEVPDQLADLEKIRAAWNNLREAAVKNSPEAPKTEQPG